MTDNHFLKAGLMAAVLLLTSIISWELFLRNKGYGISYDDGGPIWSDKRSRIYLPSDKATVFIGSSRIKYDLDIPTWESMTGEEAVQLAMEGTCPLPVLKHLAEDEDFKGKLVIDVTEGLFFSGGGRDADVEKNLAFYDDRSPSEKAGFKLNTVLESNLVFLDKDNFSLNALLNKIKFRNRKGVFVFPDFPLEFGRQTFARQSFMTEKFLIDTNLQNKVKDIWKFFASLRRKPPPTGDTLNKIMLTIKDHIDLIKARGGQVLFVRTPSSGPFWMGEQKVFPRSVYWEPLLKVTNTPGIHFADYAGIDNMICPEFSHLSPKDAVVFTQRFVSILEEKGWKFSGRQSLISQNR